MLTRRWVCLVVFVAVWCLMSVSVGAQTETPTVTPTVTPIPTATPWVWPAYTQVGSALDVQPVAVVIVAAIVGLFGRCESSVLMMALCVWLPFQTMYAACWVLGYSVLRSGLGMVKRLGR